MTRNRSTKRPWLAAFLALLQPGLGHLYLREWLRAVMWFGFFLSSIALFLPESVFTAAQSGGLQAYIDAVSKLSLQTMLPILTVEFFNIFDAYWMALRRNRTVEAVAGERCPACGREVDDDLDFCQWCTTPLTDDQREDGEREPEQVTSR